MDVPGRIDWNSMEFLNVGQKICGVPVHLPLDQFCMSKQGEKKTFPGKRLNAEDQHLYFEARIHKGWSCYKLGM